jgi:hypothetical protein
MPQRSGTLQCYEGLGTHAGQCDKTRPDYVTECLMTRQSVRFVTAGLWQDYMRHFSHAAH